MSFKQHWTSFWERQQEAFDLHLEARQNSSFLEDFVASDTVNGPIVKATERKILYGTLTMSSGLGLSVLANYLLHLRRRKPPTISHKLVLLSIGGVSPFAAHFGSCLFVFLEKDRKDAYVKFNRWVQNRSEGGEL